jgi:hypothetical protein
VGTCPVGAARSGGKIYADAASEEIHDALGTAAGRSLRSVLREPRFVRILLIGIVLALLPTGLRALNLASLSAVPEGGAAAARLIQTQAAQTERGATLFSLFRVGG